MFDVGWSEATVILLLALLLFGPDKLTEFAKTLGKLYGEYKTAKRRLELELLYGKEVLNKDRLKDLAKSELGLVDTSGKDFAEIVDFTADYNVNNFETAENETDSNFNHGFGKSKKSDIDSIKSKGDETKG